MTRLRVVIPADSPPLVGRSRYLADLQELADVVLYADRPQSDDEKLRRLQDADILLNSRGHVRFTATVLNQLPQLKMIAVCGIGYDAIDLAAATSRGIVVSNIPGRTATVVAEHAFALMLAVARRLAWMTAEVRHGRWPGELGVSLIGRRVGVIGTGNIGRQMLRLCRQFGMEAVAWSFHPQPSVAAEIGFQYVTLPELLQTADVVSVHVRLSEQSRGLIGPAELAQMKPDSILINTARSAIVPTSALADALQRGALLGAGIDVYDAEPVAADSPLLSCRNVVLTPHSADQTQEGLDLLTLGCVDNIRAFLQGSPTHVVNPDVLNRH
jgi:phosphoglycerate dehydrogenase-like enzyme